jgi:group II intron reverse transcriptase/maturase
MTQTQNWGDMSPELMKVAERAKREPSAQFHSLAHHLTVEALERAYHRLRADAATGVDGVTKEMYGLRLEENLRELHARLRDKRYRHQPILRVYIDKEDGGKRPLGVSAFEDKLVQDALREVLSAVYEQDFLDCSYGFRLGRSAHDAIRVLHGTASRKGANWILEADIRSFFDTVPHQRLLEMIRERVSDRSLLRLVGKCLHAGVLEGEQLSSSDVGTPQGSVLSPLLANIYLHYVLDVWFEDVVKPRLFGHAELVRYADDFVICFSRQDDANRVMDVLPKRMAAYGLTLHPDKTRLICFHRPPKHRTGGKGPGTYDFLGFTFYWRRARDGRWVNGCKTRASRLRRAIRRVGEYCRRNRHNPIPEQYEGICRRLRGHYNYFGVNGNIQALRMMLFHVRRTWFAWLRRRGQRRKVSWERYTLMLERYPLPRPHLNVRIWATP